MSLAPDGRLVSRVGARAVRVPSYLLEDTGEDEKDFAQPRLPPNDNVRYTSVFALAVYAPCAWRETHCDAGMRALPLNCTVLQTSRRQPRPACKSFSTEYIQCMEYVHEGCLVPLHKVPQSTGRAAKQPCISKVQ